MVLEKKYYSKKDRLFDSDEDVSFPGESSSRKLRSTKILFLALVLSLIFIVTRYWAYLPKQKPHHINVKLESEPHADVFLVDSSSLSPTCDKIEDDFKFDCFPRGQPDQSSCEERGCCWSPTSKASKVPYCYYPKNFHSYKVVNVTKSSRGLTLIMNITANSVYPDDVRSLKMSVYFETPTRLRVKVSFSYVWMWFWGIFLQFYNFLQIVDNEHMRYEPPYPEVPVMGHSSKNLQYSILVNEHTFGFAVVRKETGEEMCVCFKIFHEQFTK